MPKGELLLEVRCEEIPARMLAPAVQEVATRLFEELMGRGLPPSEINTGFTPRRLVFVLKGLAPGAPDRREREIGPPVSAAFDEDGTPTRAAVGFAKRCGVAAEDLQRFETEKGEYVGVDVVRQGERTPEVLARIVPEILAKASWAKTMRWGKGTGPWVRPVHGLVVLYDGELVPCDLFDVAAGATTCGHPVLSPDPFTVNGAADYRRKLRRRGIEIDFEARRTALSDEMERLAAEAGGRLVPDPPLLARLTAVCEIPGVVQGSFDDGFLALPREVLIASLRDHQSAFTIEAEGELLPTFLTLMDRSDDPEGRVRAGNEWVVEARLADARFFFEEDRKRPLAERAEDLERLVFHEKLGTYADKTERLRALVKVLCEELEWSKELADAEVAAGLLKADLTTEMVKEFTSLQGTVGGLYARQDGASEPVWQAIYDQYLPVAADDGIPRGRVGMITGMADRIDSLVGLFGLGLVPSGSRDPFGLRRSAQGLVRIVLEASLPLDLDLVAARAVRLYESRLQLDADEILQQLRLFLEDRVRHLLGREGFAYDEIEAALAVGGSPLPDLRARVAALHRVRDEPGFLSVVLAAKRIANIVKDAPEHELDEELLEEEAEKALQEAARSLRAEIRQAESRADYETGLRGISKFADVLERFFVEVLVMDENRELRHNRIALLQSIQRTLSRTARLTEMVVDKSEARKGES